MFSLMMRCNTQVRLIIDINTATKNIQWIYRLDTTDYSRAIILIHFTFNSYPMISLIDQFKSINLSSSLKMIHTNYLRLIKMFVIYV
jgi:hypothetical protein